MRMRTNYFLIIGVLALMSSGCELGPVGTPPPLTKVQVQALLGCQHTIKTSAAAFMHFKVINLGSCADKILELQLALENGLITQAQFDIKVAFVRQSCLGLFEDIGKASTKMANAIISSCSPVRNLILSPYDPLQFVLLGETDISDGFPGFLGSIASIGDIVRYTCITAEIFMDSALFYNMPRLIPLLDIVGLDPGDIPLNSLCVVV